MACRWLVDPPTTGGNPKFVSFFPLLECPYRRPFPWLFLYFCCKSQHNRIPLWGKGKRKFHDGRSFSFFQTFPPFSFWFFVCRFSWGAFFKIQFHCGLDQVRMCLSISVLYFLCFQNVLVFRVTCWLLVLSASWIQMVTGIWTLNLLLWFLVTSIRQPIHGPHPLIGRSSTSSIGFYFITSIFGCSRKKIFFPVFRRTTDVQQFVKDFCFHQSQTWWVPADYVGLVIGIVNIVNYSVESNQTNSIALFCLNFDYISAYWNGS